MPGPSPDHWDALIAVVGVALGSVLSLAGAAFVAWRERKYRRHDRLLAKLDELAVEDQTVLRWLSQFRACQTMLEMQLLPPSLPLSRMESLAALYFDRLKQPVAKYSAVLRSYNTWAFSQVSKFSKDGNLPHPLLWCLTISDKESLERHHQNIQSCHKTLADSVVAEAKLLLE
jgi:hypothetical protein